MNVIKKKKISIWTQQGKCSPKWLYWGEGKTKTGGKWGGSQGEMGKWMVKLSRLIIEREGSSAPQEIETQRKKGRRTGLGIAGNYLTEREAATDRALKKEKKGKAKKRSLSPHLHTPLPTIHIYFFWIRLPSRPQCRPEIVNHGPYGEEFYDWLWTAVWCPGNAYGSDAVQNYSNAQERGSGFTENSLKMCARVWGCVYT